MTIWKIELVDDSDHSIKKSLRASLESAKDVAAKWMDELVRQDFAYYSKYENSTICDYSLSWLFKSNHEDEFRSIIVYNGAWYTDGKLYASVDDEPIEFETDEQFIEFIDYLIEEGL